MDRAVEELKYTLEQANEYFASTVHHREELHAHSEALREDIDIVERQMKQEKAPDREAEDIVRIARRMRRNLEKLLFPLQRAAKAAELQLEKERLEIEKRATRTAQAALEKQTTSEKKVSNLKLPNLKLPVFKGEVEQWRGFKQVIQDITDADEEMSTTKKWLLLREHLAGKALELVQELPAAPETFKVAMDILEQSYGSVNKAVTHLYNRLQNLPVSTMSNENLRLTHAKIDGMLRSLESLGEEVNANRFLRTVVIGKFPREVFLLLRVNDEMDLDKFRKKIAGFIASNENSIEHLPEKTNVSFNKDLQNKNRFRNKNGNERSSTEPARKENVSSSGEDNSAIKKPRPAKCTFCNSSHYSDQCDVYKTIEQRKQKLGERCHTCLRMPHPNKTCARKIKCAHCEDTNHNRALCPKKFAEAEKICQIRDIALTEPEKQTIANVKVTEEVVNAGYVTMMLETYASATDQQGQMVRAILDTASRRTLVKRSLVLRLGIPENKEALVQVYGVTNMSSTKQPNATCKIYLKPREHQPIVIDAVIMEDIIDDITAPSVTEFRQRYPQFNALPIPDEGNGKTVELLIGTRTLVPILTLQNSIPVSHTLQLLSTKFGWVILGGYDETVDQEDNSAATLITQTFDPVKLMCELDLIGLKGLENTQNEEEAIALEKFYETLKFGDDNRYEMGLPYRYDPPDLETNFGLAWGRLQSLYRKLSNLPELLQTYDNQIREQEQAGIIEKVQEITPKKSDVHYIAHQVVVRMDKTTPVRIVVDASAHPVGKRSLNDNILKGANWVDDMPALIMRFRKHDVAVTADVSKAFHQLSIRKEDRDVCRFLWLKDITKPPSRNNLQTYRFCRVAFGIASSPFLLYATIKYHLRKHPHEYTHILENDFYADNLVTSIPSSSDLQEFYTKIKDTFRTMSMNLTKWATNSSSFRQIVPAVDQSAETNQTVLGLDWKTDADTMAISVKQNVFNAQTKLTKRRILQEAATIFDPLGWAMPITLQARIFIRQVWQRNYTWDEAFPESLTTEWEKIRNDLIDSRKITMSRKMFTSAEANNPSNWELHIFSDASIQAYAVVVFIKSKDQLAFVASKARLAPKIKLSVPRLELIAAVVASRFATYVRKSLKTEKQLRVTLWTDSKCVLAWLRTTKILPAYVQKAVSEIKSNQLEAYKYVPTDKNPADVASRGANYETLQDMEWWQGPTWLRDEKTWPLQEELEEKTAVNVALRVNQEEKVLLTRTNVMLNQFSPMDYQQTPFQLDPKRFRTFEELLKRSAHILHAVNRIFSTRIGRKVIPVENEKTNFKFVRKIWLKWDQERAYKEIAISKKSNVAYLRNISIFKDEDGLLRCATRLQQANENYETVYPILLVKDSPLTALIVISLHLNNLHAGTSHTLAALRRAYWLPQGRQQVYKIIKRICSTCQHHRAKPFALPEMAPLPAFRIQKTETPFRNTGVDTFGPIEMKNSKLPETQRKKWVIIFTCMIVRAVHLEVLDNMTSEEFLQAFRKFIARRGTPEILVSDNAPQFCVVERKFVDLWHYISEKEDIVNYFAKKQISWKFIPPHSPWMGGVYERLIRSIKVALEKIKPTLTTSKQLSVILTEIEAMMNSRPITYVDKNIDSPIITPNHFLAVKYPSIPVDFEKQTPNETIKLWKEAEEILTTYWRKWSEHYVLALRDRVDDMNNPHQVAHRQPKVGEVVLMAHPMKKRSLWTKAIVERLIPSQDGHIRSVQIKMPSGARFIRPINKLLPLDLITDLPDVQNMQLDQSKKLLVHQLPESVEDEINVAGSSTARHRRIPRMDTVKKTEENVSFKQPLEKFLES